MTSPQPSNDPCNNIAERFLALWKIGHDTASIAQVCRVTEATVYNTLARVRVAKPRPVKRNLIPFVGQFT